MNCFEHYLVELLQGHITYDDTPVEVVKRFSNAPRLPVITLDLSGGVTTDYVYHDTEGATEVVYFRRTANINLNMWCNTEQQKESVNQQILDCFYKEKTNHFSYCQNAIEDGVCADGLTCRVQTVHDGRTIKNKCPDPDLYGYESLAVKHNILPGTIMVEPPFDMDEYTAQPPLLRSIFHCRADYEEPVLEHGTPIEGIEIRDVDIS